MINFLIYALILWLMFQFRNISHYIYVSKCFKLICKDSNIQHRYKVKINGEKIENPRRTIFNTLYFYVIVPFDMPYQYIDEYLSSHMGMINEVLLNMDLSGIVDVEKTEFKYIDEEKEEKEPEYRYVIKFFPSIDFFNLKLNIAYIVTLLSTWIVYKLYFINVFTIFNFNKIINILIS